MTDAQALEIGRIFVKGEACVTCPHLKSTSVMDSLIWWTSCDVTNGKAPYEECRGIKKEDGGLGGRCDGRRKETSAGIV